MWFIKHCTIDMCNLKNTCRTYWICFANVFYRVLGHEPRHALSKEFETGATEMCMVGS